MAVNEPLLSRTEVTQVTGGAVVVNSGINKWSTPNKLVNDEGKLALYSHSKCFAFQKFSKNVPKNLLINSGMGYQILNSTSTPESLAVNQTLDNIITSITSSPHNPSYPSPFLQPLLPGEYDVTLPLTKSGLCIGLKSLDNKWIVVKNWMEAKGGLKGEAEKGGKVQIGDAIVGVNGKSILGKDFSTAIGVIGGEKEGRNYIVFRFLAGRYLSSGYDMCSQGKWGEAFEEDVKSKMRREREELKSKIFNPVEEKVVEKPVEEVKNEEYDDEEDEVRNMSTWGFSGRFRSL